MTIRLFCDIGGTGAKALRCGRHVRARVRVLDHWPIPLTDLDATYSLIGMRGAWSILRELEPPVASTSPSRSWKAAARLGVTS